MNNRRIVALVLIIGLLAFPRTSHAFSFSDFFGSIFSPKTENRLPASTSSVPPATLGASTIDGSTKSTTDSPTTTKSVVPTSAPLTVAPMLSGDQIKQLQLDLTTLGYYSNGIDGVYGTLTNAAVSKFQSANSLAITGIADQTTLDALTRICIAKLCPILTSIQCIDGKDNDNDSFIDYPNDPGCSTYIDNDEYNKPVLITYQCSDKIDNDNDGLIDYPSDPGCTSSLDDDEYNKPLAFPQCSDKVDNDGDSLVDSMDPGCHSDLNVNNPGSYMPAQASEANKPFACADGIDNDADGLIDSNDPGCHSDGNVSNPGSYVFTDNDETNTLPPQTCANATGGKVYFTGGLYNTTGVHNDLWCSLNMISWSQLLPDNYTTTTRWSARWLFNSALYFNNKLWVMGNKEGISASNDVWSSSDGVVWTHLPDAPWSKRSSFATVTFNGKIWVLGGQSYNYNAGAYDPLNDVWYSSDGTNWTQATAHAPWGPRNAFAAVVYKNKIWVIGGYYGVNATYTDAWSSSDGTNWTLENQNAVSVRGYHTATVFNNKIWVIGGTGGFQNNQTYDDVIMSDGTAWSTALVHGPWGPITGHSVVVWNNKLWLLGGVRFGDNQIPNAAIWSSFDGVNWTQEVGTVPWPVRYYQAVVVSP